MWDMHDQLVGEVVALDEPAMARPQSVLVIGPVATGVLLKELPALSHFPHRQPTTWVGMVPINRDSGCFQSPRTFRQMWYAK